MIEAARVELSADVHRPAGVGPEVANVAQRDAAARRARARRFDTFPQIIKATDIIKETQVLLLKETLALLLLCVLLGLGFRQLRLRLCPVEGVPSRLQLPSGEEHLPVLPPVGVRLQSKVHELSEDECRLLHPHQIRSTEVRSNHEALDS